MERGRVAPALPASPLAMDQAPLSTIHTNEDSPEPHRGKHILAIDGIRGLAVLLVIWAHFLRSDFTHHGVLARILGELTNDGWIGVEIFFVLSGFLITGILFDTLSDPSFFRNFYARRILRIFPLYYGFLLLLLAITLPLGYRWTSQLGFVLTYTQSLQRDLHFNATNAPWVTISLFWTLSIEELFYFIWPLLVYLLRTKRRIAFAATLGILLSLMTRVIVSWMKLPEHFTYIMYSWAPCRFDGLLSGGLLAMLVRSNARMSLLRWAKSGSVVFFMLLIFLEIKFGGLVWEEYQVLAIWLPLLLSLGFACMIAWTLRPNSLPDRLFSASWLRFFGRYSYGLYIFHFTIAMALLPLRAKLADLSHSKGMGVIGTSILAFVLSIASAFISYNYFEVRFLRLKSRFHARSYDRTSQAKI